MDSNYAAGWLWAYRGLKEGKLKPEEIEQHIEGRGFVMGREYATGARAGIMDWKDEEAEQGNG